jgi:FAD/FMN-containing dehydrogenase/Fe-S oxidoreductase
MSLSPDFIAELRKYFAGEIRLDPASRTLYSTDASIYQIEPLGVALPKTQEALIAAVELAAKYQIPVLPRGAGSSLAGQAIGPALILDCSRYLDQIIRIDAEAQTATVEPGVVLATLNRLAAKHGLTFGPDPASAERATLGGVIGNNATGAHSILYGMAADHLLSAEVILSDGSLATWGETSLQLPVFSGRSAEITAAALEIREKYAKAIRAAWPTSWRNSAGYRLNYLLPWSATQPSQWNADHYPPVRSGMINLATLLAGSEGTLAVIRTATVNLVRKPKHTILGVLAYESIAAACDDTPRLLAHSPSAVELVPQMLIRLARGVPAYASQLGFVQGDPAALLVVEFSGENPAVLREKARALRADVLIAETAADQARVWNVRKVGLGIFDARPAAERPIGFIEDCAIPVERLGEFVREVERILASYGTEAAFYAHASAGTLHIRPIINLKTGEGVRRLRAIAEEVLALTLRVGGAMSSEHGDGLARSEWLRQTYGDQLVEALQTLKRAADPDSLFNPEKLLDAPPMDTHLRYGENYRSRAWKPALDFSRNGGLVTAIEQCNGQGVCRKDTGVMCPSFQAIRDEQHSTRGRANLLRALISLPVPLRKWAGAESERAVKEALDLCLACKGCKSECPSGVDMAKLKYEFQSHYYSIHRRPLRDYLFGYIGIFARLGAPLGGLINWFMERSLPRKLLEGTLGVTERRAFPKFSGVNLQQSRAVQKKSSARHRKSKNKKVEAALLLPDTFTHYFEPVVEQSALEVLAACGVDVKILPVFGAGRTLISKGFIEPAKRHAAHLLDEIQNADPTGILPVIGLEPSEIYTLRDELLDLLPERRAEIKLLAKRAWLIDEYLMRPSLELRELRVAKISLKKSKIGNRESEILLHGHCYQKAQPPHADGFPVGVEASAELLRAAGYQVKVLNTGCCGMAGAFGYEAEHYEVSMQVGELALFPAIRSAIHFEERGEVKHPSAVVALGTSCRSQIADGTGVEARHSIVMVARKLKASG